MGLEVVQQSTFDCVILGATLPVVRSCIARARLVLCIYFFPFLFSPTTDLEYVLPWYCH